MMFDLELTVVLIFLKLLNKVVQNLKGLLLTIIINMHLILFFAIKKTLKSLVSKYRCILTCYKV